jgi:hypothetical protein
MKSLLVASLLLATVSVTHAYGPPGHRLIGDIAAREADNATVAKVRALVGDLNWGSMACLPDDIKSWDPGAAQYPDSLAALGYLNVPEHADVLAQLRAFHDANVEYEPGETERRHASFHYADIPVKDVEKYADGPTGRRPDDVVQMIKFCAGVLHGDGPESNRYKITKPVAVILLMHYVGDIHQPLHVGAEYFNAAGQKANPDTDHSGPDYPDQGGNSIVVGSIAGVRAGNRPLRLHAIWDSSLVDSAKHEIRAEAGKSALTEKEYVAYFAAHPPANWEMPAALPFTAWSEAWANEIQPIAREAHEKLQFTDLQPVESRGITSEHGTASEAPGSDYYNWGGGVVKRELGLAGYRLAALLKAALQ